MNSKAQTLARCLERWIIMCCRQPFEEFLVSRDKSDQESLPRMEEVEARLAPPGEPFRILLQYVHPNGNVREENEYMLPAEPQPFKPFRGGGAAGVSESG